MSSCETAEWNFPWSLTLFLTLPGGDPLLLALRLDFSVPLSLLLLQCNSIYEQEIKGLYSYLGSCNLQIRFETSGNNYILIPYIAYCKFERNILQEC